MASLMNNIPEELFKSYIYYNGILVVKMGAMSLLRAIQRMKNKTVASPEDVVLLKGAATGVNADVERVRRAHLNDLENIPIYFVAAYGFLCTNPPIESTLWLMRAFTAARVAHTFVYAVCVVPQPARGIAYGIGAGITTYMAIKTLLHFCK